MQGDGISVFDVAAQRWDRYVGGSGIGFSANVLGISHHSLWLGTPNGQRPLVRISRSSWNAEVVADVPQDHYISAIDGDSRGAWVAWSAKHYADATYSVQTWVARIVDPNPIGIARVQEAYSASWSRQSRQ